jgi:hypothetical protein
MPSSGAGPRPRISTGLSTMVNAVVTIIAWSGDLGSPEPRSPIEIIIEAVLNGIERNITFR